MRGKGGHKFQLDLPACFIVVLDFTIFFKITGKRVTEENCTKFRDRGDERLVSLPR